MFITFITRDEVKHFWIDSLLPLTYLPHCSTGPSVEIQPQRQLGPSWILRVKQSWSQPLTVPDQKIIVWRPERDFSWNQSWRWKGLTEYLVLLLPSRLLLCLLPWSRFIKNYMKHFFYIFCYCCDFKGFQKICGMSVAEIRVIINDHY